MKLKFANGQTTTVTENDFLARGGGGEIYVKSGMVYKVCHNGHMPPPAKLKELAVLDRPYIIRPLESFRADDGREGYSMTYVESPVPITKLVTLTYRHRNKIQPDTMLSLVRKLQEGVHFVHSKNILIVDLNELNYLTDKNHTEMYFIDVDSYQTPSFPAQVIMPSVRDYTVTRDANGHYNWSKLSDWYSFAIVSFQILIGMHPFQGNHPRFTDPKTSMEQCMRAGLSLLNPDTKYPKRAVMPFDVIPPVYLEWYKAVFEQGKRLPPPSDLVQVITVLTPKVKQVAGSNNFVTNEIFSGTNEILDYYPSLSCDVIVTTEYEAYINKRKVATPPHPFKVGFAGDKPVAAYINNNKVYLQDLQTGTAINFTANGEELMATGGRLYIKNHSQMLEVQFSEYSGQTFATPHKLLDVMDRATQVFDGVLVQSLFDAYNVTVFPGAKQCRQFQIRELDGYRVVDAKYDKRVLMIVAVDAKTGKYDRFIFRFARDWSGYDLRLVSDIPNLGINFAVRDDHRVACITEDMKLEIFLSDKDNPLVKSIADPLIEGDMKLWTRGNDVLFSQGAKMYTITVRKP